MPYIEDINRQYIYSILILYTQLSQMWKLKNLKKLEKLEKLKPYALLLNIQQKGYWL